MRGGGGEGARAIIVFFLRRWLRLPEAYSCPSRWERGGGRGVLVALLLVSFAIARVEHSPPNPFPTKKKTKKNDRSGTFLATGLNVAIAAATTRTKEGPWVADNSLYGRYDLYFYVNAAILLVAFVAYIPVSRAYVERPIDTSADAGGEGGEGARAGDDAGSADDARALQRARFEDKAGAHLDAHDNAVLGIDKK